MTAERYNEVNVLHDLGYPSITRAEAGKVAKILIRAFGSPQDAAVRSAYVGNGEFKFHSARRSELNRKLRWWTSGHRSGARRVWVSTKPTTGHHRGWGRLIHDVGHMVFRWRHPNFRPHDHGEEQVELDIARYVRENMLKN